MYYNWSPTTIFHAQLLSMAEAHDFFSSHRKSQILKKIQTLFPVFFNLRLW